jgi:phosphoribosylamine-glycine ligase
MGVVLCRTPAELQNYQNNVTKQHLPMLLESYLDGPLFTLETLSDGQQMIAVGGFDVTLSPLPYFIETGAIWNGPNSVLYREQALGQVRKFGVNFGVCHSEFIVTPTGPVLVEINYRSIGDGREFLLNKLLPFNWFEKIIMLHAGESLAVLDTESKLALIQYFPNAENGFLAQYPESFDTQRGETEIFYKALKRSGQHLTVSHSNKDYLGMLTVIGETASSIKKAANQVAKQLAWEIN